MTRVVNDVTLGEMLIIERQVCPPWPDKAPETRECHVSHSSLLSSQSCNELRTNIININNQPASSHYIFIYQLEILHWLILGLVG